MNSIERHLGVATKAATLLAMRSAKKEILLVVEGDSDISLMSNTLGIPRSNLLSCNGKEILMDLFKMSQQKGIDPGTIFIRDRDFDFEESREFNDVLLLVTNRYDIEMELLENGIFNTIITEYSAGSTETTDADLLFKKVCTASGCIGALRLLSNLLEMSLDFDDLKYNRFFDVDKFSVSLTDLIRYVFAKSKEKLDDIKNVENEINKILNQNEPEYLACGKETIDLIHIFISRKLNKNAADCSTSVITRMIRVAAGLEDMKMLSFFPHLRRKIKTNPFEWTGKILG